MLPEYQKAGRKRLCLSRSKNRTKRAKAPGDCRRDDVNGRQPGTLPTTLARAIPGSQPIDGTFAAEDAAKVLGRGRKIFSAARPGPVSSLSVKSANLAPGAARPLKSSMRARPQTRSAEKQSANLSGWDRLEASFELVDTTVARPGAQIRAPTPPKQPHPQSTRPASVQGTVPVGRSSETSAGCRQNRSKVAQPVPARTIAAVLSQAPGVRIGLVATRAITGLVDEPNRFNSVAGGSGASCHRDKAVRLEQPASAVSVDGGVVTTARRCDVVDRVFVTPDLLDIILSFVPASAVGAAAQVCRAFRDTIRRLVSGWKEAYAYYTQQRLDLLTRGDLQYRTKLRTRKSEWRFGMRKALERIEQIKTRPELELHFLKAPKVAARRLCPEVIQQVLGSEQTKAVVAVLGPDHELTIRRAIAVSVLSTAPSPYKMMNRLSRRLLRVGAASELSRAAFDTLYELGAALLQPWALADKRAVAVLITVRDAISRLEDLPPCGGPVNHLPQTNRLPPDEQAQLTSEQIAIINQDVGVGNLMTISAFAGTGKTSTLRKWCKARRKTMDIIYIVFNKLNVEEAVNSFPGEVCVKTLHGFALNRLKNYAHQRPTLGWLIRKLKSIKGSYAKNELHKALGLVERAHPGLAKLCEKVLAKFLQSDADRVEIWHAPYYLVQKIKDWRDKLGGASKIWLPTIGEEREWLRMKAQRLYDLATSDTAVPLTFDVYLAFYCLHPEISTEVPQRDWNNKYIKNQKVILLDECQDHNPRTIRWVLQQLEYCGVIAVGDDHQGIYRFRGARSFFETIYTKGHAPTFKYALTESFRFGNGVAELANAVLRRKEVRKTCRGRSSAAKSRVFLSERAAASAPDFDAHEVAFIHRTNKGVFDRVLEVINLACPLVSPTSTCVIAKNVKEELLRTCNLIKSMIVWCETGKGADHNSREWSDDFTAEPAKRSRLDFLIKRAEDESDNRLATSAAIVAQFWDAQQWLTDKVADKVAGISAMDEYDLNHRAACASAADEIPQSIQRYAKYNSIHELVEGITKFVTGCPESSVGELCEVMEFMTVHKSKGREFNTVVIGDDLKVPHDISKAFEELYKRSSDTGAMRSYASNRNEELNLLYVAITRSKQNIVLPNIQPTQRADALSDTPSLKEFLRREGDLSQASKIGRVIYRHSTEFKCMFCRSWIRALEVRGEQLLKLCLNCCNLDNNNIFLQPAVCELLEQAQAAEGVA